jgi:hypothetical protein
MQIERLHNKGKPRQQKIFAPSIPISKLHDWKHPVPFIGVITMDYKIAGLHDNEAHTGKPDYGVRQALKSH